MKKFIIIIAVLFFCVTLLTSSENEGYYSYSYARLSYVKGDVFVQRAQDLGYEEGVVNLPVVESDKLGTREGRAEIHFGKRNYLRVDNNTQVDFVSLPKNGYDLIKLHILSGSIYLRVNFLEKEKDIEIHTPDASFYVLDEGLYRLNVIENRESELFVYDGAVEAAGEEGSLLVEREQRLVASSGHFNSSPTNFYASLSDSFHQWNEYRDSLLTRRVSRRYLPSEMYEYEEELADNGRWVYEPPYGHVWVPRVYYSTWRPYYYGRWLWYPIIGWTWVSYDPWGWCVSHYGRWHWRFGLGWYWIPTRFWGPGWVHWYRGHRHIGWCPLSYHGYPGVIINNRFYGRYYSRYYPLHSRALVVVHKSQLQARRISRAALKQSQIRSLGKISLSSRKPSIKPVINRISKNSVAAKALSRSNIRKVGKAYVSGKTIRSPSRLKSSVSRNSPRISRSLSSSKNRRTLTNKAIKSSSSKILPRNRPRLNSSTSSSKSSVKRNTSSRSAIKQYPSRATYSSRSKLSSTSKLRKSISPKKATSPTRRPSSRKALSLKSRVKAYPSRSSSSSSQYISQRRSSALTKSYSSRRYSPPSRSYTRPSRSYSRIRSNSSPSYASPKRSVSSSRRSISSPSSRSSSRSSVRRSSSSRSSSSRSSASGRSASSSRGRVRKK
ncbi:MAG: DUF6600 domain-containing protein [Candidatus Aminicenantaceae bacterium]